MVSRHLARGVAVVCLSLLAACGGAGGSSHTISGDLALNVPQENITDFLTAAKNADPAHGIEKGMENGFDCSAGVRNSGLSDIRKGSTITVRDGDGKTLAVGKLGGGLQSLQVKPGNKDGDCIFTFSVADVPEARFYRIEVEQRGEVEFSAKDLAADQWKAHLTVG